METPQAAGLSTEEARKRLTQFGFNELADKKGTTPLKMLLHQFCDVFMLMLLVAISISALFGEIIDAATITVIVLLNVLVGFIQEYRSEKAIEAMRNLTAPKTRVLRDGKEMIIPAKEVVPGDIVILEMGDRIPADGQIIEAVDFRTNEAVLTGESNPVEKETAANAERKPSESEARYSIFMGTHVVYGRGKALVMSTGMNTQFGKIAAMVQTADEKQSPLKMKLKRFAKKLGVIIVVICAVMFFTKLQQMAGNFVWQEIIDIFMTSVALAVAAVPEGLPAVVTVSLALGAKALAKRNAIIRKLTSAETLGATTVICSDKTGTLTKGEMTVRQIYVRRELFDVSGVGYEAEGQFYRDGVTINPQSHGVLHEILKIAALCTNARYDGKTITGDTTEAALLVAAAKAGIWQQNLEKHYPRMTELIFTSERKRMTTIHRNPDGKLLVCVKGGLESVLERCTHFLDGTIVRQLTEMERQTICETHTSMAGKALRILAVACKETQNTLPDKTLKENAERDLVFIGLIGMMDPPRAEGREANLLCQQAGIKVVMITGDHKLTAVAVARELDILRDGIILTGEELGQMSDGELENVVEKVTVYARVLPEHKLRIVKAFKKKGQIVAMMGDGVNDAPALKQSDIGVAMGITGTDVTREAADIVLADDNFSTVVSAVHGGRTIYDNIRKFSFFLLSSNLSELAILASFGLLGLVLPLTAGMILWVNLVTDGGPAIALSMDPPADDVMQRPPRSLGEGILRGKLASILAVMIFQCLGTAGLFYIAYYLWGVPLAEARTMAFLQITLQELVIVWNCRSDKHNAFKMGFMSNKSLTLAVMTSLLMTLIVPYLGLFGTVALPLHLWAIVIPVALAGFLIWPEFFYGRKILRWV